MRTKLALAGLITGTAMSLAPLSPASAVCGWDLEGTQQCGNCLESEVAKTADTLTEDVREEHGIGDLEGHVVCAH